MIILIGSLSILNLNAIFSIMRDRISRKYAIEEIAQVYNWNSRNAAFFRTIAKTDEDIARAEKYQYAADNILVLMFNLFYLSEYSFNSKTDICNNLKYKYQTIYIHPEK